MLSIILSVATIIISVATICFLASTEPFKAKKQVDPRLIWPPPERSKEEMDFEIQGAIRRAKRGQQQKSLYTPGCNYIPGIGKDYYAGLSEDKYPVCTQCAGSLKNGVCEYCKTQQR
jgi:hypothetical protein